MAIFARRKNRIAYTFRAKSQFFQPLEKLERNRSKKAVAIAIAIAIAIGGRNKNRLLQLLGEIN